MSSHLDPTRSVDPVLELSAALAPRYRLEREVGRGGTTTVYLARATDGGQPVVVKVLHAPLASRVGAERFVTELFAASRFRHPAALPILDAAALELETGTLALYYVVPWADGESLRTRLEREGLLPVAEALRYGAELAGALAAAHAQGLVHGDIRPENVILTGTGALLADLGVARALAGVRPVGDAAADLQGLGRVLYEMLAGEPAGDPPQALRARRRNVPEDAELLVAGMLAARADDRQGAAGFAASLRAAAEAAGRAAHTAGLTTGDRLVARQRVAPRWGFFTFALLAVTILTVWLHFRAPPPVRQGTAVSPPPPPGTVAVLPLVNASPDSAEEYLSDGMTEELVAGLGRVPGLRVTSAASSFALGRRVDDAQRAGVRLGAGAVLEGSVRLAAGRLRITVHLVSVREGFDLWSETYERAATDLFVVEDEIVRGVATALRRRARPRSPTPTVPSLAVHARVLEAGYALRQADSGAVSRAIALYGEAIAADSGFAPAWAGLARGLLRLTTEGRARPRDAMPRAAAAAERALGLDSSLAGARATLGAVRFLYDWSWSRADTALREALALDPNGTDAARWYARLLLARGRPDEALAQGRAALELDPVSPAARVEVGRQLLLAGFLPEAETALERAWQADSSSAEAARSFGLLAELRKDYPLAEARYRRGLVAAPDDPALLAALGRVEALAGRPDSARARLQRLDSLSAVRWVSPYHLATVAEALDDRRRAYAWLDAAVAERSGELAEAGLDPRLGRLRDNRRWDRVARAVGLPEREGGDYNPPTSTPPSRPGRP